MPVSCSSSCSVPDHASCLARVVDGFLGIEITYKLLVGISRFLNLLSVSTTVMRFATIFTLGIAIVSTSASLLVRQTIPCELTLNFNQQVVLFNKNLFISFTFISMLLCLRGRSRH